MLLSGGLDSAVALYIAKKDDYSCECLSFDYGQRHRKEIAAARSLARAAGCPFRLIKIALPWKGSALVDKKIEIPEYNAGGCTGRRVYGAAGVPVCRSAGLPVKQIPATYVPARNIIFLSFALSYAEASGARAIFIGAHSQDYSGYPDCRAEFFRAFEGVIKRGTKAGVEGLAIRVKAPLLFKSKAGIVRIGARLGVPFALTWSCYRGQSRPCGSCDSCRFRAKGFHEAGIEDPLLT